MQKPFSFMSRVLLALALMLLAFGSPSTVVSAQITYGTLDNFDVINDTGGDCHDFEIALIGHWRRTGPPAAWDALVASPWVQVPLRATLAWGEGFARVFSGTDWLVYVAAAILWGISSLRTRELAARGGVVGDCQSQEPHEEAHDQKDRILERPGELVQ